MTLNDVMAVILRYFTEFGKDEFQHITALICGGIYARKEALPAPVIPHWIGLESIVFCSTCTMSS